MSENIINEIETICKEIKKKDLDLISFKDNIMRFLFLKEKNKVLLTNEKEWYFSLVNNIAKVINSNEEYFHSIISNLKLEDILELNILNFKNKKIDIEIYDKFIDKVINNKKLILLLMYNDIYKLDFKYKDFLNYEHFMKYKGKLTSEEKFIYFLKSNKNSNKILKEIYKEVDLDNEFEKYIKLMPSPEQSISYMKNIAKLINYQNTLSIFDIYEKEAKDTSLINIIILYYQIKVIITNDKDKEQFYNYYKNSVLSIDGINNCYNIYKNGKLFDKVEKYIWNRIIKEHEIQEKMKKDHNYCERMFNFLNNYNVLDETDLSLLNYTISPKIKSAVENNLLKKEITINQDTRIKIRKI